MENTYQLIKRIENDSDFLTMLKKGLIPLSFLDKKVYYEYYLNDLNRTGSKPQSIFNTSEEYDKSEITIRRAIIAMEE